MLRMRSGKTCGLRNVKARRLRLEPLEKRELLATFILDGPGTMYQKLYSAINDANINGQTDTILIPEGDYLIGNSLPTITDTLSIGVVGERAKLVNSGSGGICFSTDLGSALESFTVSNLYIYGYATGIEVGGLAKNITISSSIFQYNNIAGIAAGTNSQTDSIRDLYVSNCVFANNGTGIQGEATIYDYEIKSSWIGIDG